MDVELDTRFKSLEDMLTQLLCTSATKAMVSSLQSDVMEIKVEVAGIHNEIMGIHGEIANLQSDVAGIKSQLISIPDELRSEMQDMRDELRSEMREVSKTVTMYDRRFDQMLREFAIQHQRHSVRIAVVEDDIALFLREREPKGNPPK